MLIKYINKIQHQSNVHQANQGDEIHHSDDTHPNIEIYHQFYHLSVLKLYLTPLKRT